MKWDKLRHFFISPFLFNHTKREANKLLPKVEARSGVVEVTSGDLYVEANRPPVTPVYGYAPAYLLPKRPPAYLLP